MSEETFTKIPTRLFQANLSNLQFRFLCNFIRISGLNNGHSFFGYPNLAEINQCGRAAAIRTVQELEKMGFIQVVDRGNRSRSNDILLTLEKGFSRCENGGSNTAKEGYLNDTPHPKQGYLNDTRGYLNDTRGYLNDTPHIKIKDLNNLNLNNIYGEGYLNDTPKEEAKGKNNIATGDVAPVRSISNSGLARNVTDLTQCELEDFLLADSFFQSFPDLKAWCKFSRLHGEIILEAVSNTRFINSKFNELFDEKREEIDNFFAKKNQKLSVFCDKKSKNCTIFIKNIEKTTD